MSKTLQVEIDHAPEEDYDGFILGLWSMQQWDRRDPFPKETIDHPPNP
jgi:hypothetical protein